MKNLLFITSNSLATNPRLVKEIRTAIKLNHKVTVVSFSFDNWSKPLNEALLRELAQKAEVVTLPGGRENKAAWVTCTVLSLFATFLLKLGSNSLYLESVCLFKRSWLLLRALQVKKGNYDWIIAHNPGAFVPALWFAKNRGTKLGIDLEDYHPGETHDPSVNCKLERLMSKVLANSDAITAASPLILEHSLKLIDARKPDHAVINNVFSLTQQPSFGELSTTVLKLVWFSQTVGTNRGIQDVILAMNLIQNKPIQLTIIGHCAPHVMEELENLLTNPDHKLLFLPPVDETDLIRICSEHHIGLALETGDPLNRDICLTNKLFVYLLAGNAIIASKTAAQQRFMSEHEGVGQIYSSGDQLSLSVHLAQFSQSSKALSTARKCAYQLANKQMNWETEAEMFISLYGLSEETDVNSNTSSNHLQVKTLHA